MAVTANVHVGDIGTKYKAKIQDNGAAFDPSLATKLQLIFNTPAGILERTASIESSGGQWFLTYTVGPADGVAFHGERGTYSLQGYLEFAGGEKFSTNIETYTVDKNLRE